MFKQGNRFRHYKGGEYEIISLTAIHTETKEVMVVYRDLSDPTKEWVRPYSMFFQLVDVGGGKVARFTIID